MLFSWSHNCLGFARPSGTTAVASTHSSPAPPAANRSYRRIVSLSGRPAESPSQPSIGWIASEFGTSTPPTRTGSARIDTSSLTGIDSDRLSASALSSSVLLHRNFVIWRAVSASLVMGYRAFEGIITARACVDNRRARDAGQMSGMGRMCSALMRNLTTHMRR